jgi:hypothetical protein
MDQMVVVLAEERKVVQIRAAAVAFPPSDVVRIDKDGVGTTGEATVAVTAPEFAALGGGRISSGPPLVHRVPHVVVESYHQGGVAGQPPGHLGIDEAPMLELAAKDAVLVGEGGKRHVGDDEVGAGRHLG